MRARACVLVGGGCILSWGAHSISGRTIALGKGEGVLGKEENKPWISGSQGDNKVEIPVGGRARDASGQPGADEFEWELGSHGRAGQRDERQLPERVWGRQRGAPKRKGDLRGRGVGPRGKDR